jgi:hypothetical protein
LNDCLSIQSLSFPFSPSSPLSGIIANLTSRYGGNYHDQGIVNITANPPRYSGSAPKVIAYLGDNSQSVSAYDDDQSICFDFKTNSLHNPDSGLKRELVPSEELDD